MRSLGAPPCDPTLRVRARATLGVGYNTIALNRFVH
jgi:hypothetical protein